MDTTAPTLQALFAQLGLPDSPQDIQAFVQRHFPLDLAIRLKDAPFWSASQSALIAQKLADDGDWALLVDSLNAQLRHHPVPGSQPGH